jgi:hypothetical protein
MFRRKSSIRKIAVTNIAILFIIAFVFLCAFTPVDLAFLSAGPVMRGNTNGNNIALQLSADGESDIPAYMDELDSLGIKATFFFPENFYIGNSAMLEKIIGRGNGVGYYVNRESADERLAYYLGSGVNVPVMSYISGSSTIEVSPSIDVSKLKKADGWQRVLKDNLAGDMFVYTDADNNLDELKKIVQIVRNKGYTILKMDDML